MPQIQGVEIPDNKKIRYSLTYIKGIGLSTADAIVEAMEIDPKTKAKELDEKQISDINTLIGKEYVIEGELTRQVRDNIKRLQDIKTYRGKRHARNLPVRGQITRHNARTRKGPRKSVSGVSVRKAVSKT